MKNPALQELESRLHRPIEYDYGKWRDCRCGECQKYRDAIEIVKKHEQKRK